MIKWMKRSATGIVVEGKQSVELAMGLRTYLNRLCLAQLTTLEGRLAATRTLIAMERNLPIYIDCKTVLIATKAIREPDALLFNQCAVMRTVRNRDRLSLIFLDGTKLEVDMTPTYYRRQQAKIDRLIERMQSVSIG